MQSSKWTVVILPVSTIGASMYACDSLDELRRTLGLVALGRSTLVTWSVAHTQTGDLVAACPAPDCSRGASSGRLGGATRPGLRWVAAECGRTGRPVGQPDCQ